MDSSPLFDFRTTYLRAIALAWLDEAFRKHLVADARKALEGTFDFRWPWQDLTLKVNYEKGFQWIGDNWLWQTDPKEQLILYLPLRPDQFVHGRKTASPPFKHAPALAAYYRQRPSLLNGAPPVGSIAIGHRSYRVAYTHHFARHLGHYEASDDPVIPGTDAPPGGFIPTLNGFANFEVALLSAMAAAWDDENFANALQEYPVAILHTIRQYAVPWKLTIRIKNDAHARYVPDKKRPHVGEWKDLTPHHLELCLPASPKDSDHAVALAAYNTTGAEYPFTCCF